MRPPRERLAMLPNRLKIGAIAVWFGVIALGLNALVPIHLAFDLAHALAPAQPDAAADHDFGRCLLTLLTGHHDDDAKDQSSPRHGHHHDDCAVSGAIGTLAGFAPAAVVLLAAPSAAYLETLPAAIARAPETVAVSAYRSRAPPAA